MNKFFLYTLREYYHLTINFVVSKIINIVNKDIVVSKDINDNAIIKGYKILRENKYFVYTLDQTQIYCRVNSSDMLVFKQVFLDNYYNDILELINKSGFLIENIIDCGANIGLSALCFKIKFPKANICLIEPDDENFNVLKRNILKYDGVKAIKGAVWYKKCLLGIEKDFRDKKDWSIQVNENTESPNIISYTINEVMDIMSWDTIDILKIDIEGAEKHIFDEKISDLKFLDFTKILIIEIHDEYECRNQIYGVLNKRKFKFLEIGEFTVAFRDSNLFETF